MSYPERFLLVVALMTIVDMCWAKYTMEMQRRHATLAGLWSVGIMLCGSLVTVNYIDDKTLIIAAAIGAFLGTYLTVRRDKSKAEKA